MNQETERGFCPNCGKMREGKFLGSDSQYRYFSCPQTAEDGTTHTFTKRTTWGTIVVSTKDALTTYGLHALFNKYFHHGHNNKDTHKSDDIAAGDDLDNTADYDSTDHHSFF